MGRDLKTETNLAGKRRFTTRTHWHTLARMVVDLVIKQHKNRIGYVFPLIIVKINDAVIPRKSFSHVTILDNTVIKLIHMINGG